MTSAGTAWMRAADAARLLDVSRATLYAYVSRGFIRSQAAPGSTRERMYARSDVERLRRRSEERRAPDKAAARALEWGMPVLESSIAFIDGQRLYYRGLDAAALARSRSIEDVAALVWLGQMDAARPSASIARVGLPKSNLPFAARAHIALATAAAGDPAAMDVRASSVATTGWRILRLLVGVAIQADARTEQAHQALARAWKVTGRGGDILRAALVLCADHELNVSSFTARCVASSGSHPYAVVSAGLSALEGPKHGGAGARVEAMLDSMRGAPSLRAAVAARVRRGEPIDGFGHPLYSQGDPRARVLLDLVAEYHPRSAESRFVNAFARAATAVTGEHPNLDFALAAITRVLRLPAGAPLMLFSIGRSVGWIGHALEQYATGQLIRPRAKYVGPPPVTPAPAATERPESGRKDARQ